jgi:hypothetical protein
MTWRRGRLPPYPWSSGTLTLVQRHTSDIHRGRIFGAFCTVEGIAIVSGTITAGFLAQAIGIIPVLSAQGAGYILAASPRWWRSATSKARRLVAPMSASSGNGTPPAPPES